MAKSTNDEDYRKIIEFIQIDVVEHIKVPISHGISKYESKNPVNIIEKETR